MSIVNPAAATRKFIDEVHKPSSRWAFWDNPADIEVGTFGDIDIDTGKFRPKGNIYKNKSILWMMPSLTEPTNSPQPGSHMEDTYTIMSEWMTGTSEVGSDTLKFKIDLEDDKPGSFVILNKHQSMYLPLDDVQMRNLAESSVLEPMFVVTELITCPSFAMGLTTKDQCSLELDRSLTGTWITLQPVRFFTHQTDPSGVAQSVSLLKLRKMSWEWKKWRWGHFCSRSDPRLEPTDSEVWEDAYPPWGPLDDAGIEQRVVDDVPDWEEENEDEDEQDD
jgi:hypothetical protein